MKIQPTLPSMKNLLASSLGTARLLPAHPTVRTRALATLLLPALVLLTGVHLAQAQTANPPDRMTYQGYLVDANGLPLASGVPENFSVIFRVYDAQRIGTVQWAEQQVVTVDRGNFSVLLGEGSAVAGEENKHGPLSDVFTGDTASDRFIEITVNINGSDTTIAPRLRLLPSPYAFLAQNATALVSPNGAALVTGANGALTVSGDLSATRFNGSAAGLTGLSASQIPNLNASKITAGTLNAARIPNLNASTITAGTFDQARIPTSLSGTRVFPGSVGIASSSPTERLDLGTYGGGDIYMAIKSAGANRFKNGIKLRNFSDGYGWTIENNETSPNGLNFLRHFNDATGVSAMFLQQFTGNLGIGTTAPVTGLHVTRGGDSSLSTHGYLVLGGVSGVNMTLDSNEIQARNNGSASTLYLNHDGGNVYLGSKADYVYIGTTDDTTKVGINAAYNNVTLALRGHANDGYVAFMENAAGTDLYAFGNNGIAQKIGGGLWSALSDQRLKTVTGKFEFGLDAITKLKPIRYHYREDNDQGMDASMQLTGFVAQDVQSVIPEAVTENPDGYLMLNFDPIYLATINAIQELNQLLQEKNDQIAALQKKADQMDSMKGQIEALKAQVEAQQEASAGWEARFSAFEKRAADRQAPLQSSLK